MGYMMVMLWLYLLPVLLTCQQKEVENLCGFTQL